MLGLKVVAAGLVALAQPFPASAQASAQARAPAQAQVQAEWTVRPDWVRAHESILAGDALRGRGSATPDEAKAAAYVASQFKQFHLKPPPGMSDYLQTATIIRLGLNGPPSLIVDGAPVAGLTLIAASGEGVAGKLIVAASANPADLPEADIVIAAAPGAGLAAFGRAARGKHIKLLILRESDDTKRMFGQMGGATIMPAFLEGSAPGRPAVATLAPAAFDALAARPGADVALKLAVTTDKAVTTNAIGYLPGTDPKAGVLLLSAHLDHLGVRPDGTVMHGANDDASGTTAVIELAHAMAAGRPPRRGILFVAYGSEEIGEYGSLYFGAHPPVPLSSIVANLEFEMIGAQDPKLPPGTMMMTGYERSNLGEAILAHGALVTADPYPEQNFFQRSDNYQLALTGIVAHTLSGWALTPTYHQPTDTLETLDIPFMTRAIQSLIEPVRWLADSDFKPQWRAGGRPGR